MNNNTIINCLRSINSKEFLGRFQFAFIVILVLVSIFAYVLAPDNSENANQMHLSIHSNRLVLM
jgi:peptide/nickel transport system permease protein